MDKSASLARWNLFTKVLTLLGTYFLITRSQFNLIASNELTSTIVSFQDVTYAKIWDKTQMVAILPVNLIKSTYFPVSEFSPLRREPFTKSFCKCKSLKIPWTLRGEYEKWLWLMTLSTFNKQGSAQQSLSTYHSYVSQSSGFNSTETRLQEAD